MTELAQRMMTLQAVRDNAPLPTAIFGTAASLRQSLATRPPIRIGMWPCISADAPNTAMGLVTALSVLLERWSAIRVYRLFVHAEGEGDSIDWEAAETQFTVDDWQLDGLDENVAIWGTLQRADEGWLLTLEIENDLIEHQENVLLTYTAPTLKTMFNTLQQIANDVAAELQAFGVVSGAVDEQIELVDEQALVVLFEALFDWQKNLVLYLWGKPYIEERFLEQYDALVRAAVNTLSTLGSWSAAGVVSHTMQPGYGAAAEALLPLVPDLVKDLYRGQLVPSFITAGLFRMGQVQEAYRLLEEALAQDESNVHAWLTLGDLYLRGGRLADSLDTFQRAIEADVVNSTLFVRYANLLLALDAQQWPVKEFVLIDPDAVDDDLVLWEAVEAFAEALRLEPERKDILQQMLLRLIEVGADERFWDGFERLVTLDQDGELVRNVIDSMYDIEDVERGVDALEALIGQSPTRADLHINAAILLLLAEDGDAAGGMLQKARALTDDSDTLADIDRLMLSAEDPEFEPRLADLSAIIDAGNALDVADVEYLESVLEQVPTFAEGYILVSRAYGAWNEDATALEVLLDGHKHLPESVEIIVPMARLLWDAEQDELALTVLEKGLQAHPSDVSLLSLMGLYLFESERDEEAKVYLAQAENVAPNHPDLEKVRVRISQMLIDRGS